LNLVESVRDEIRKRSEPWTWQHFYKRRRLRKEYISTYKQLKLNPKVSTTKKKKKFFSLKQQNIKYLNSLIN